MKLQFPIESLLAVVGFCGVAFAALRSATDWWASGVFTATLFGLALASAYAIHRRGPRRAFWATFAAFGWGYLLLAFGPWCETLIRPRLLTTKLLDSLSPLVHPAGDQTVRLWDVSDPEPHYIAYSPRGGTGTPTVVRRHFQDIGHSLSALVAAAIGGLAARSFYAHRDERRREAAEKAAGVLLKIIEAGS